MLSRNKRQITALDSIFLKVVKIERLAEKGTSLCHLNQISCYFQSPI